MSKFSPLFNGIQAELLIRNANSHDCEKLRSEANSHKIDSTFASQFLKRVRFRNWNRLRIRRAKSVKNSLLSQYFYRFLRAQLQCTASDILNICTWPRGALEQRAATFLELSLLERCDGSATLKNMSRLFCAILVDTATLQQNETICPLTPGNLTMESLG